MPGRVLLLQGPVGPFFSLLAEELKAEGHEVFKIHFNGGDEVCYRQSGAESYRGDLASWPGFLEEFIRQHEIDRLFLFGDCRSYHVSARAVARRLGVAVFVFEEGYLRPYYVTIEPGGVNGYSALSRAPEDYLAAASTVEPVADPVGSSFWTMAGYAARYYIGAWLLGWKYPYYRHHRSLSLIQEGACWIRSGWRKLYYKLADRPLAQRMQTLRRKRYYLVPLQVHCDAQVTCHSRFASIEDFIAEVLASFAQFGPQDTELLFKHHPMDRGYRNYGKLIRRLAGQHGVEGRVHYLHEGHLPTLLRFARGSVTINSTVGLSSIHHRTPVKVLGRAIYDLPGLTAQNSLDEFWKEPGEVDYSLYRGFRQYLTTNVLGVGSFYRRTTAGNGATGIRWPLGSITAASNPARAAVLPATAEKAVGSVGRVRSTQAGNAANEALEVAEVSSRAKQVSAGVGNGYRAYEPPGLAD